MDGVQLDVTVLYVVPAHSSFGQGLPQGFSTVTVGTGVGQLHGFVIVDNLRHALTVHVPHIDWDVTVGQPDGPVGYVGDGEGDPHLPEANCADALCELQR